MEAKELAVRVSGLRLSFGATFVLRGLDLQVAYGERLAVLGANGAGKTTLLKTLATLIRPSSGNVEVAGYDALKDPGTVRQNIGLLSHKSYLYDGLTSEENLTFYGRLYRVDNLREKVARSLDLVGLTKQRRDLARTLSHGQQRRLSLARAIIHDPRILLLDEPDTGLDSESQNLLEKLITGQGYTVILTTHNPERFSPLVHRFVALRDGRIVDEAAELSLMRS